MGPIETCYSGPEVAVLHAKTTGGVLDPQRLVILVLKSLFACTKQQMRAGTHVNLIFWCKLRCFACTKRQVRCGTHADSYTGPKVSVLQAKPTDEGWDP